MTTIAENPSAAPEEYLPKIRKLLEGINNCQSYALARAIECGKLLGGAKDALAEANKKLPKSKQMTWASWVRENLDEYGIAYSTADLYIQLYDNADLVKGAKSIRDARKILVENDPDHQTRKDARQKAKEEAAKATPEPTPDPIAPESLDVALTSTDPERLYADLRKAHWTDEQLRKLMMLIADKLKVTLKEFEQKPPATPATNAVSDRPRVEPSFAKSVEASLARSATPQSLPR